MARTDVALTHRGARGQARPGQCGGASSRQRTLKGATRQAYLNPTATSWATGSHGGQQAPRPCHAPSQSESTVGGRVPCRDGTRPLFQMAGAAALEPGHRANWGTDLAAGRWLLVESKLGESKEAPRTRARFVAGAWTVVLINERAIAQIPLMSIWRRTELSFLNSPMDSNLP